MRRKKVIMPRARKPRARASAKIKLPNARQQAPPAPAPSVVPLQVRESDTESSSGEDQRSGTGDRQTAGNVNRGTERVPTMVREFHRLKTKVIPSLVVDLFFRQYANNNNNEAVYREQGDEEC